MATSVEELYEQDFFAWTRDQAARLRELKETRPNLPLDLEHLAEEVDDLGTERRDAVRSQVCRVIEHCLKLEYSAAVDPRRGWLDSVIDVRGAIEDRLTASIRQDVGTVLPRLYGRARRKAENGLLGYGEREAAHALPAECPYALDDLLRDEWYPPNGHGIVDAD